MLPQINLNSQLSRCAFFFKVDTMWPACLILVTGDSKDTDIWTWHCRGENRVLLASLGKKDVQVQTKPAIWAARKVKTRLISTNQAAPSFKWAIIAANNWQSYLNRNEGTVSEDTEEFWDRLGPETFCCSACSWTSVSCSNKIQRNYKGLTITACMHSWTELRTQKI